MPLARRFTRALTALALTVSCLGTASSVYALDPPRPLPGYSPVFVTEREAGIWEDCTWAAAAMLLDKWTNGTTKVSRERLRKLSGDLEGGSSVLDVQRAFAKLGFGLKSSPLGGEAITWPELLDRLAQGGGAILAGDYGKLPRQYARWAPETWDNTGPNDDHALYLDAYDPARGTILVMDPLAPAGWTGEWMPLKALKKFAWHASGGALWTVMTPAAIPAPFAGVTFGEPSASADAFAVRVAWPTEAAPEGWAFPGADIRTTIEAIAEAGPADVVVGALPAIEGAPPVTPTVEHIEGQLTASIPLPTSSGIYRVTVTVTDRRLGRAVATMESFSLYVPGPRAARFVVPPASSAEAGRLTDISFGISNVGSTSWADPLLPSSAELDVERRRNARLVGRWIRMDTPAPSDAPAIPPHADAPEAAEIPLGPVRLEPIYGGRIDAQVRMPAEPGKWRLVIDVVDDQEGSFAASGSAPGIIAVEVLAIPEDAALQ